MTSQFFEAVLFDMDGLTIDSEPQWLETERELTAEYGYDWKLEDQAYCLGGPLSKVGQYISDLVDQRESGPYFHNRLIEIMAKKVGEKTHFMPGAKELIESLNLLQIPIALVSASPRVIVDAALKNIHPITFGLSISADDVRNTKPDPEGYLKAANALGAQIRRTLILEDSLTGVTAARASGARVIAVPHLVKIEPDNQTKVLKSLTELSIDQLREYFFEWF